MRTTGKFDKTGNEIFEGDKVLKCWGWASNYGKIFQIHTINVKSAHLMANGEMHDDGGGIIFCLGEAYNFWEGNEVLKLSEEDVKEINIPENKRFFVEEGKAILESTMYKAIKI